MCTGAGEIKFGSLVLFSLPLKTMNPVTFSALIIVRHWAKWITRITFTTLKTTGSCYYFHFTEEENESLGG